MKNNNETSQERLLGRIFIFLAVLFIISTTFDLTITYYNYLSLGEYLFSQMEANKLLIWGIQNNFPLLFNPAVFFNFVCGALSFDAYLGHKKKPTKFRGGLAFTGFLFLVIATIGHFVGGFSWVYLI